MFEKIHKSAAAFDSWRVFPRIFISVYMYLLIKVVDWFMAIKEPNMEQATLVSVIVGAGAAWFGLYVNTNRDGKVSVSYTSPDGSTTTKSEKAAIKPEDIG